MADELPFIETPEQARRRTSIGADLVRSGGSPIGFLAALLGRGMQAARPGPGPQKRAVQDAEQVQSALQRAMAAGFAEGKPPTEANSAFLVKAVQELNGIGRPDLALQFAQQLGAAEQDRAEVRNSLLAGDAAKAEIDEFNASSPGRIVEATSFGLQDTQTGEIEGPFVLSEPAGKRAFAEARARAQAEGRQVLPVSAESLAQLNSAERIAAMRLDKPGGSIQGFSRPFEKFRDTGVASLKVLSTIAEMSNVVRADIQAGAPNAAGEKLRGMFNNIGFQARSLLRANPEITVDEYDKMNASALSQIQKSGLRNAQFQSLALDLAYALARVNDPSGRLSDFDVELAIKTTQAAQADPTILLSTLSMIARRAHQRATDAALGIEHLPEVQTAMDRINERMNGVTEAFGDQLIVDLSTPQDLAKFIDDNFEISGTSVFPRGDIRNRNPGSGARVLRIRRKGE